MEETVAGWVGRREAGAQMELQTLGVDLLPEVGGLDQGLLG